MFNDSFWSHFQLLAQGTALKRTMFLRPPGYTANKATRVSGSSSTAYSSSVGLLAFALTAYVDPTPLIAAADFVVDTLSLNYLLLLPLNQ